MNHHGFRWWWPTTHNGRFVLTVLLVAAGLTVFIDYMFFWINVLGWYLIALVVRAVWVLLLWPWWLRTSIHRRLYDSSPHQRMARDECKERTTGEMRKE